MVLVIIHDNEDPSSLCIVNHFYAPLTPDFANVAAEALSSAHSEYTNKP